MAINLARTAVPAVPQQPAPTQGNQARLFVADNDTYQEALRLIDGAQTQIQFETFTFNGEQGQGITEALIRARQRGVDVRVVLDTKAMFIGNQRALANQLVKAGVDVRNYQERKLNAPVLAIDHAKILAVDGQKALVGGTNFDRRVNYDLNYELQGPAVPQIQDTFSQSWRNAKPLEGVQNDRNGIAAPASDAAPDTLAEAGKEARTTPAAAGDTRVTITQTAPKNDPGVGAQTDAAVLARINKATKSIDLLMYNLDDNAQIAALKAAQARGVQVRVILNPTQRQGTFGKLINHVFNLNDMAVEKLRMAGIPVKWFKLPPGLDEMHAKVAVFDGQEVLGGSTNWVRSSNLDNHELGVWLEGPIAGQVQGVYENLWQNQSTPIATFGLGDRLRADLAGLVSRFL